MRIPSYLQGVPREGVVDVKLSIKAQAWPVFDRIVNLAAPNGVYTQPWRLDTEDKPSYMPDFETLQKLLGVPLYFDAKPNTGVPALALDVWIAYELRRAGFHPDAIWPRASHPRIL